MSRRLSTLVKHLPDDSISLAKKSGGFWLTLNRPSRLNALTISQSYFIRDSLTESAADPACKFLILSGAGERAFCAGGDVVTMAKWGREKTGGIVNWFSTEYKINCQFYDFQKPIISLWRGVVMGGGVGLSIYGRIRVATDSTVWAMPETGIGFIPDIGASFFLPRLVNKPGLGLYLALTGARLHGADAFRFGLATHYVPGQKFPGLVTALETAVHAESTVAAFSTPGLTSSGKHMSDAHLLEISNFFTKTDSFEIFWKNLISATPGSFAHETISVLRSKCPLAVRLAFELFKLGERPNETLRSALAREYRVAVYLTELNGSANFAEGVRAQLIDKGKGAPPSYNPAKIEDVTEAMVKEAFWAGGIPDLQLA